MMTRRPWVLAAGAGAAVLLAFLLDPWIWLHGELPGIYEKDWGRLLRVMGSLVVWFPFALAVWLESRATAPERAGRAWLLLFSPALAGLAAELLKLVFRRERPGLHDGEYVYRAFTDRPFDTHDLGLPSSHAAVAFGGAAIVARLFPRAGPIAYVLAAGCALSRIMARAHFLSDVTVAAIVGVVVGGFLWYRVERSSRPMER
ncbi:MAG: phosphatase PAP2 family protein [Gemmatimonadales bacterium]|nr:phosphatase PAP2 family protein [Gemmatimonadales bacterium]